MLHRTKEDDEGTSAIFGVRNFQLSENKQYKYRGGSRSLSPESGLKHFLSLLIFLGIYYSSELFN